jgi:hypothetical protein
MRRFLAQFNGWELGLLVLALWCMALDAGVM